MPFKVGPNGWLWKWTCNLWWWRGLLWGCLNPLRGGQVKAGKQGNKYFPVEKAWCRNRHPTKEIKVSAPWEGKVDGLLWTCLLLMPERLEGLKMFSLENEKTKDYFFLLFQSQKEEIEVGTPKQKLKTIEVVFVYSKRSTGIWYCEKFQRPGKTSGTKNCDQNYSVFSFFKYFSKFIKVSRISLINRSI